MASDYVVAAGIVQQFKDKPAVSEREVSSQTVREFTIKAVGSQKLIKVTLFPEFADVAIEKGSGVFVDGKYTVNTVGDKTYYNLTATSIAVVPPVGKAAREVVNQGGAAADEESPF